MRTTFFPCFLFLNHIDLIFYKNPHLVKNYAPNLVIITISRKFSTHKKKKEKAKQLPNQFQNVSRLLQFFLKGNRSNEMIIKAFSLFIYFFFPQIKIESPRLDKEISRV